MKTFRQNLHIWLEDKKNSCINDEEITLINEIQKHIKKNEKEEQTMVDYSYLKGYYDAESKKGFKHGFYTQTYKSHDYFKNMIKL